MAKLERVYSARDHAHEIELDIIAIHGLDTDPDRSFNAHAKEGDPRSCLVNWLSDRDMLPAKLRNNLPARIFTYRWEANTIRNASAHSFKTQAQLLLDKIWEMRNETETTELPFLFVASCFGGILLAKALVRAAGLDEPSPERNILSRTKGIVFLGTPFRGSPLASAAEYRIMVAGLVGGSTASDSLLRVLGDNPGDRDELTDAFVTLASEHRIALEFFYETEKTDIANALSRLPRYVVKVIVKVFGKETKIMLVPEYSACLDGPWSKTPLKVKHALINKFRGPTCENFRAVSTKITTMVGALLSRQQTKDKSLAQLRLIAQSLRFAGINTRFEAVHSAYDDAFGWLLRDDATSRSLSWKPTESGTSEWEDASEGKIPVTPLSIRNRISSAASQFNRWLYSDSASSNTIWVSGKPGAGKSTFMKVLVSRLRVQTPSSKQPGHLLLHHFFLLLGEPAQRSKMGMIRTLLSQIFDHLLENGPFDTVQEILHSVPTEKALQFQDWREGDLEELLCRATDIFGRRDRRVYVCIDGLDEFDRTEGPKPLLDLLTKLRAVPGLRMIVSGRPEKDLSTYFEDVPKLLLQDVTTAEMYHYAYTQLEFERMGEFFAERIVSKAEGVFLWVSLVVKTLLNDIRAGASRETLSDTLDKFPKDMAPLYNSIWTRHNQDTEELRSEAALYFQLLIDSRDLLTTTPGLCFRYWIWQLGEGEGEAYSTKTTLFHFAMACDETLTRSLLMHGDSEKCGTDAVLAQCKAVHDAAIDRGAGIIEIKQERCGFVGPQSSVQFLHRTAHDFFVETEDGRSILRHNRLGLDERRRRLILSSLAQSYAFRSVVNRYGVCHPVPASELHRFLVNDGIFKESYTSIELEHLEQYCRILRISLGVAHGLICGGVAAPISQGLSILSLSGLPDWLRRSTPQDKARVLHFAMLSWRAKTEQSYCELLAWTRWLFFVGGEYETRHSGVLTCRTRLPAELSAFGPMDMSTFQYFFAGLARFVPQRYAAPSFGRRIPIPNPLHLWLMDLSSTFQPADDDRMHAFFFFNDDSIPAGMAVGQPIFGKLCPDRRSYCAAEFMIIVSFQIKDALDGLGVSSWFSDNKFVRHMAATEDLYSGSDLTWRRRHVGLHRSMKILAMGHVCNIRFQTDWGPARWKAKTVPKPYHRTILDTMYCVKMPSTWKRMYASEEEPNLNLENRADGIFSRILEDPNSRNLGNMSDYLVKLGIVLPEGQPGENRASDGEQEEEVFHDTDDGASLEEDDEVQRKPSDDDGPVRTGRRVRFEKSEENSLKSEGLSN